MHDAAWQSSDDEDKLGEIKPEEEAEESEVEETAWDMDMELAQDMEGLGVICV